MLKMACLQMASLLCNLGHKMIIYAHLKTEKQKSNSKLLKFPLRNIYQFCEKSTKV